jgi:hypothetical protein
LGGTFSKNYLAPPFIKVDKHQHFWGATFSKNYLAPPFLKVDKQQFNL